MKLPKDLLSNLYKKPNIYLCETDKTKICKLDTSETKGSFKFNGLSEISFEVARVYNDLNSGETKVNPYYDKIEALRLIYVEGFGYFELQGPELVSDGVKESKTCKAYALEYTLAQKYLEDFYINTGEHGSVEVTVADGGDIIPVTLYNPSRPELSLLDLVLEKDYGNWTVGHVDLSLQTLSRKFEIDRQSIYDFLINEVCEKFNCYIVFDTISNKINLYAESRTAKFIGDGTTNIFIISPSFSEVNTVSVNGYKTTRWEYDSTTGKLILEDTPEANAHIEVVDGALADWETDVFISFDNLSQEININYDADSIKTILTVTYGDDGTIHEVNLGLPYLTDLSYYYTVDWMGQDLYDAYTTYLQKSNKSQTEYADNAQKILELQNKISFAKEKISLGYGMASNVNDKTVGTYYVISGGSYPNYFYTEVSLPGDYNANTTYYKLNGVNITERKVLNLFSAVRKFFVAAYGTTEPELEDMATKAGKWDELLEKETESFDFVASDFAALKNSLTLDTPVATASYAFKSFLDKIWTELGSTPLEDFFLEPYKQIQSVNAGAGFSVPSSPYYYHYYPVTIMIDSLKQAIHKRKQEIAPLENELKEYQEENAKIADGLLMDNNFTKGQLARLSAFLREDELHLDDIVETSLDDINGIFKVKQDALESGRIELQKLCQPQLQFSMSMANIYALPEFEPIVGQFQLGNVIKVALRSDYIKNSRLLQVDINFDDFSDFSCEFGELTNLRTQSDIHADLLSNAISAGKSVATNSSYWTRGADTANSTDLKIKQGLLDATTQIKAIDGNQSAYIDKYGIHLQKVDPTTGEIDPHQTWMVNNMILMSDDGFKTSRSALGQVTVDGYEYYGLISELVLAGYIEGSKIVGGTIRIGEYIDPETNAKKYHFEVDENGNVTIGSAKSIKGYATETLLETTAESIRGVVKSTADNLQGQITDAYSQIEITAGNVKSEVGEIITSEINGVQTEVAANKTLIDQNAENIKLVAESVTTAEGTLRSEFEATAKGITSKVEALGPKVNYYGTCSTESDVVNKTVNLQECENFSFDVGTTISVKFDHANTATSPTLSVYGSKDEMAITNNITVYGSTLSGDSIYNWTDNATVVFVCDGTNWSISDSGALQRSSEIKQTVDEIYSKVFDESGYSEIEQKVDSITSTVNSLESKIQYYGTCSTASNIAEKTVYCTDFKTYGKGTTISVKFNYKNAAAAPKLKIDNGEIITEAKYIRAGNKYGSLWLSDSVCNWSSESTIIFVYDGTYWRIADSGSLSIIEQTATSITKSVSDTLGNYSTTTQTKDLISNTVSDSLGNYSTTQQTKDMISQAVGNIGGDYTKIEQNANNIALIAANGTLTSTSFTLSPEKIKIAWNSVSDYIQFENGQLNIYDTSNVNIVKLYNGGLKTYDEDGSILMWLKSDGQILYDSSGKYITKFGRSGLTFYTPGSASIGAIGTSFMGNEDYKGLLFALHHDEGDFMSWGAQEASGGQIQQKLAYYRTTSPNGNAAGFHFWANVNMHNYTLSNVTLPDSSDARLKTNIQDTSVNALNVLGQIEMKEFDWIESGEHCEVGMIAQQLQMVLPSLIYKDEENGSLSIKTTKFIPYLIKAIQELQEENRELQKCINVSTATRTNYSSVEKWIDPYTDEEKKSFVLQNSTPNSPTELVLTN